MAFRRNNASFAQVLKDEHPGHLNVQGVLRHGILSKVEAV